MPITAQSVIDDARLNLLDNKEPYYHTTPDLLRYITDASIKLSQDRPDLLLTTSGTLNSVTVITAVGDNLIYEQEMKEALVNYVCYLALLTDSEDTQNLQLSQQHKAAYVAAIS